MKDLKAIKGRYLIQRLIDQGEHEQQDFKFAISDARKIARSVSAFANNSGGCLLIGVKDNGTVAGVRNEEDVYVVEQAAQMYCDPPQPISFDAFKVDPGVIVIRATVPRADRRPVRVLEADGRKRAYYRVADENIVAHPLMVRAWMLRDAAADSHAPLLIDDMAGDILSAIRTADGPVDPETLPLPGHRSKAATNSLVATLISLGLLHIVFVNHSFRLVAPDDFSS